MFGITWYDIRLTQKIEESGYKVKDAIEAGVTYKEIGNLSVDDLRNKIRNAISSRKTASP